ncbi:MAG: hypothetical protein K8R46_00760 [Pirellulales bacterium]|nr:hypothetical protein [Pirellulales bacterium]
MNEFIQHMKKMAYEAGQIAVGMMDDSHPTLKADNSVLTEADLKASAYIKKELSLYLDSGQHILIDEEDKESARYLNDEALSRAPYAWVIDPIDGTRAFSNRVAFFGVSIGLLKDRKPWLGLIYLPLLNEMFYADGQDAYFVSGAFTDRAHEIRIQPVDLDVTQQSIFFGNDTLMKAYRWDFAACHIMLPSCAIIDLCYPAIGRGVGCFFNSNLWDFAGSWPIYEAAGLHLRSLKTGEKLEQAAAQLFRREGPQPWRLKEDHILSSERNFPILQKMVRPLA